MQRLRWVVGVLIMTLGLLPLSSWAQELDPSNEASALVRFIHAVPGAGAVDIYLDGQRIVSELSALQATDYGFVGIAQKEVAVWGAGDDPARSQPLLEETISLGTGRFYTFGLAGREGGLEAFLFEDHTAVSEGSEGSLRLVHLAPNQAEISASVDNAALTALIGYGEASDRSFLDASKADVVITVIDQAAKPLLSTEPISLEGGKFQSLFVVGADQLQELFVSYPLTSGEIPDFPIWRTVGGSSAMTTLEQSASLEQDSWVGDALTDWPMLLCFVLGLPFILLVGLIRRRQKPKARRRI